MPGYAVPRASASHKRFAKALRRGIVRWGVRLARGSSLVGLAVGSAASTYNLHKRASKRLGAMDTPAYPRKRARIAGADTTTVTDDAGFQQFESKRDKMGRKMPMHAKILRHLSAHVSGISQRWSSCNAGSATTGVFNLSLWSEDLSAANTSFYREPYYLLDLTSPAVATIPIDNQRGDALLGTRSVQPPVMQRLCRAFKHDGTVPGINLPINQSFFFLPQAGVNSENGNSGETPRVDFDGNGWGWMIEKKAVPFEPARKDKYFVDKISADILMYGATSRPSEVTIEVVSFVHEDCCPTVWSRNATNNGFSHAYHRDASGVYLNNMLVAAGVPTDLTTYTVEAENNNRWNASWLQETAKLVGNPLITRMVATKPIMKKHYSKTFRFNPTQTSESDARGHQCRFSLDYSINKMFDLKWAEDQANGTWTQVIPNEVTEPDEWVASKFAPSTCVPRPGTRMYLCIKGKSWDTTAADADGSKAPSFDIVLRRRVSALHVS